MIQKKAASQPRQEAAKPPTTGGVVVILGVFLRGLRRNRTNRILTEICEEIYYGNVSRGYRG